MRVFADFQVCIILCLIPPFTDTRVSLVAPSLTLHIPYAVYQDPEDCVAHIKYNYTAREPVFSAQCVMRSNYFPTALLELRVLHRRRFGTTFLPLYSDKESSYFLK